MMENILNGTLLKEDTVEKLLKNSGKPEYDLGIHANVIYTEGGWALFHDDFGAFSGFYGWSGIGGATMLLDPKEQLVVAFTTSRIETMSPWDDVRTQSILG